MKIKLKTPALTLLLVIFAGCSKVPMEDKLDDVVATRPEPPPQQPAFSPRLVLNAMDTGILLGNQKKWAVVRGRVFDVFEAKSGKVVNLNFGPDYKNCFKAVIFQGAFTKWQGGVNYLRTLNGRQVSVEGSIEEYKGLPQIIINSPSQIRIEN